MKTIENIKSIIRRALKNEVKQTAQPTAIKYVPIPIARGYDAAKTSDLLANWRGEQALSEHLIKTELPIVRKKCLDLYLNSALAKRAMQIYTNNIVGSGFRFSASVKDENGVDDVPLSDKVEDAFNLWAGNPQFCHTGKRFNLTQLLKQAVQSWMLSGEAFLRIDRGVNDNPFGFSVDIIRADMIAVDRIQNLQDGKRILNGVEVDDRTGEVLAYHIYKLVNPTGVTYGFTERVPA